MRADGKREITEGFCERCGAWTFDGDYLCESCRRDCWETRYEEDQCGNCQSFLKRGDKYCRICGTKAGEGAFEPWQNIMECLYGPMPVERRHNCYVCGYSWKTEAMIDRERFCPKCGSPEAPSVQRNSRRGEYGG